MDELMRGLMDDQSNGRVALYKFTPEGKTPSHIWSINPTDSLPLRLLIPLGLAGELGLDLNLIVVTSSPPQ